MSVKWYFRCGWPRAALCWEGRSYYNYIIVYIGVQVATWISSVFDPKPPATYGCIYTAGLERVLSRTSAGFYLAQYPDGSKMGAFKPLC